jgi:hypothetical protein
MSLFRPDLEHLAIKRFLPASGLEALLSSPTPHTATIVFGSSDWVTRPIIAMPLLTVLNTVGHTHLTQDVMHNFSHDWPPQAEVGLLAMIGADDHRTARRRFLRAVPSAAGRFLFSIHAWSYQTPDGLHAAIGEVMDAQGGLHGSEAFAEKAREDRSA